MSNSLFSLRLLVLSLIGTVLLASVSLGLIFNSVFEHLSKEAPEQSYAQQKALLAALASQLDTQAANQGLTGISENEQLPLSITPRVSFPLPKVLSDQLDAGQTLVLESAEQVSLHHLLPSRQEVISLGVDVNQIAEENESLKLVLTSLFYLSLVSLILIWLYPLLMRLLRLREAAKDFGKGDFSRRVEVGSGSYIADIEREFNSMANRIESLIDDIKLLSSAASHDLRTPLARIRFGVETMAEEDHPAQRENFQKRIIRDVDSMVDLVEQLLNYTRLEQRLLNTTFERVDLTAMLHQIVDQAGEKDKTIELLLPSEPAILLAYNEFIRTLLNNLIGNAVKYAEKHISVTLNLQHGKLSLTVEDDGPGIAEDKRQDVLQPFVRGNDPTSSPGFGLGLAVAKRISEHFGGNITICSSDSLGGAKVNVMLRGQ